MQFCIVRANGIWGRSIKEVLVVSTSISGTLRRTLSLPGLNKQKSGDWGGAAIYYEKLARLCGERCPDFWFRAGNAFFRAGDDSKAVEFLREAVLLDSSKSDWWYRLGFVLERQHSCKDAIEAYTESEETGGELGRLSYRRARCFIELGDTDSAKLDLLRSIQYNFQPKKSWERLESISSGSIPLWQQLDLYRNGQEFFTGEEDWTRKHAVAAWKMGAWEEAIRYFDSVARAGGLSNDDRFKFAYALEVVGRVNDSMNEVDILVEELPERDKKYGRGAVFQQHGYWARARHEYRSIAFDGECEAERLYRIGFTYDREYCWKEAIEYYLSAVRHAPDRAYWWYKSGHAAERLNDYRLSAGCYLRAVELDEGNQYWWYRAATVMLKLGTPNNEVLEALSRSYGVNGNWAQRAILGNDVPLEAFTHLKNSLCRDFVEDIITDGGNIVRNPSALVAWAEAAVSVGLLTEAMRLSQRALAVGPGISPKERMHIAQILHRCGEEERATDVLFDGRLFQRPDGVDIRRLRDKKNNWRNRLYAEFLTTRPVNEHVVLFESNHGSSVGCHPLAIFREMSRQERFSEHIFVWAVNDIHSVPEDVKACARVVFVPLHSDEYLYHLATAKYLVNNVSFAPYFVRRPEQRYLNTWHGTPMKTLGKSMHQGTIEYENLERNFLQTTHIMVPNELTRWAIIDEHHLDGIYPGSIGFVGSPRLDRLVRDYATLRERIRQRLNVSDEDQLVLVAPTWRGGVSSRDLDIGVLREQLLSLASIENVHVVYRAHRLTESLIEEFSLPAQIVPSEIDTNDLLAAVDHLITDYSSVAFDFLVTGKPVTLFVPDEDEYSSERGLYLRPEELPFGIARDLEQLVNEVKNPSFSPAEYEQARNKYCATEDGRASSRCIDFFLSDDMRGSELNGYPTLVFHASLIPNGIASSFIALVEQLSSYSLNVVLVIEPNVLRRESGRLEMLKRLPDSVKLVSRVGDLVLTPEEAYIRSRVEGMKLTPSDEMKQRYEGIWKREAKRVLGDISVDCAIEWDGYAALWANFVLGIGDAKTTHCIWQHNDMGLERREKFPELSFIFWRYGDFDKVVSVSRNLASVNQGEVNAEYGDGAIEIDVAHNIVPIAVIQKKSLEKVDSEVATFMKKRGRIVVTVGRMSPEKNQTALLTAWKTISEKCPDWGLVVVGSGPLEADLRVHAESLAIEDSVFFAGQLANPLPVLAQADLFVLPSLHEGQPVVLFEAMTLGVPILASALPGNLEAMDAGYGSVIGTEPDAIVEGIITALEQSGSPTLDASLSTYVEHSLTEFEKVAGLGK